MDRLLFLFYVYIWLLLFMLAKMCCVKVRYFVEQNGFINYLALLFPTLEKNPVMAFL